MCHKLTLSFPRDGINVQLSHFELQVERVKQSLERGWFEAEDGGRVTINMDLLGMKPLMSETRTILKSLSSPKIKTIIDDPVLDSYYCQDQHTRCHCNRVWERTKETSSMFSLFILPGEGSK